MAWLSSLSDIALVYNVPEEEIEQRMYSLAEFLHQHYCLQRGIINHNEARPDQHVALSMLGAMASADWFLVRGFDRLDPTRSVVEGGVPVVVDGEVVHPESGPMEAGEPVSVETGETLVSTFIHFGDDTVNDSWANDPEKG